MLLNWTWSTASAEFDDDDDDDDLFYHGHRTSFTFWNLLRNLQASQDHRLISAAHFLFVEFDSLVVPNTRAVQEAISKTLTEWMIKKEPFKVYDAQALMHLACLNIKLCQVRSRHSVPFLIGRGNTTYWIGWAENVFLFFFSGIERLPWSYLYLHTYIYYTEYLLDLCLRPIIYILNVLYVLYKTRKKTPY